MNPTTPIAFSDAVEKSIQEVSAERQLGASQVSDMSAQCYIAFSEETAVNTQDEFWTRLYALSRKLVWAQPDMAPIFSLANAMLSAVQEAMNLGGTVQQLQTVVRKVAEGSIEQTKEAQKNMSILGMSLIEENDTILTHSHSSSVQNLLIKAHRSGKSFQVIATESRPGLEGKKMAQDLGRQGIMTTLIVEAAALGMMDRCHKVFVGADRISEKHFVNKVGTRAIALGAKELERDFFVVCDTSKFVPKRFGAFARKQHPPEEVLEQRYPNVIVENPYFEAIPLSLVTVIICEEGLLPPAGVIDHLQQTVYFPEMLEPE